MTTQSSAVQSSNFAMVRVLLRLEGLAVLAAALIFYAHFSGDWLAFVLLLFAPDLSAVGFAVSRVAGSVAYNIAHFYALPIALGVMGVLTSDPTLTSLALIWLAHIGMDRALTYGLRYPGDLKDTHIRRA